MKGDMGVGRAKGRGLEECFHEPLLYLLSMDKRGEGVKREGQGEDFLGPRGLTGRPGHAFLRLVSSYL